MEKEEEKLSMSARTEEAIVQLILDKNWQPGQQIPPEPELCTLLGASRNTLREAIRALVARNVLDISSLSLLAEPLCTCTFSGIYDNRISVCHHVGNTICHLLEKETLLSSLLPPFSRFIPAINSYL